MTFTEYITPLLDTYPQLFVFEEYLILLDDRWVLADASDASELGLSRRQLRKVRDRVNFFWVLYNELYHTKLF